MPDDTARMYEIVAPLIGQSPWRVWLGVGSSILLEFGKHIWVAGSTKNLRYHEHGEWHWWVWMSSWFLQNDDELITACEDTRDNIHRRIKHLEGKRLLSIQFLNPALETILSFESNLTLRLCPTQNTSGDGHFSESWMLFDPNDYVLSATNISTWRYKRADEL